jgi:hypothetical protein
MRSFAHLSARLLFLGAGILPLLASCTGKPISTRMEPTMVTCPDNSPAALAAAIAKEAVPQGQDSLEGVQAVTRTLDSLLLSVFDTDHDGRLNFEEYAQRVWAQFLVSIPSGECRLTKTQFLDHFLGRLGDKMRQEQAKVGSVELYNQMFDALDRDKDGFVTFEEVSVGLSRTSFRRADKDRDGFVTLEEHRPGGYRPKS